jgi:CRP/FNR family cyclic AMP-dependent transcriptional regulator
MFEKTQLFSELAPDDARVLTEHSIIRTYPRNAILVSEGDETDSLYVLISGKAKVFVSDENGKEMLLSLLGPGEYFGELALLDECPRSASVMTLTPCKVSMISKSDFHRCLANHPQIALNLIRALTRRVRSLTENVKNLALLDVYGRVARTLLNLAEERDGKRVIEQKLTHQDIANMVGSSREMVTRIFKDLTTGGYITLKDHRITINEKLPPGW